MNKNCLLIRLGGAGKTTFNKMILDVINEPEKPEILIVYCFDLKDTEFHSYNMPTEEKTNE